LVEHRADRGAAFPSEPLTFPSSTTLASGVIASETRGFPVRERDLASKALRPYGRPRRPQPEERKLDAS